MLAQGICLEAPPDVILILSVYKIKSLLQCSHNTPIAVLFRWGAAWDVGSVAKEWQLPGCGTFKRAVGPR